MPDLLKIKQLRSYSIDSMYLHGFSDSGRGGHGAPLLPRHLCVTGSNEVHSEVLQSACHILHEG